MLPSGAFDTLDTWPSGHPFGMCGQDGSTTNFGTSTLDAGRGGVAEARCDPAIVNPAPPKKTMPALRHNFRFSLITLLLLFGSSCDRSDSTQSTPSNSRIVRFLL